MAIDLTYILTFLCTALLCLQVMAVGMLEPERVYTAKSEAQKLEKCVSGMCQDVAVGTAYVVLSFHVPRWRMFLNFF